MSHRTGILCSLLLVCVKAQAVDVAALWQPGDPAASEVRMRAALASAEGDDALIIRTQIARTYVFRRDFERAREILGEMKPCIGDASPAAQARFWLELGRSHASHQHPPASRTAENLARAREAYGTALAIAEEAHLDDLAVDALHMFPFVETDPLRQLSWLRRALTVVLESEQPAAHRWEASIRSNLGETLFDLARYPEALTQFRSALLLREREGASPATVRDATWHVARTLRILGELDEALGLQQRIADEALAANQQRHYIHDELSLLYAALGDSERARHFAEHGAALRR